MVERPTPFSLVHLVQMGSHLRVSVMVSQVVDYAKDDLDAQSRLVEMKKVVHGVYFDPTHSFRLPVAPYLQLVQPYTAFHHQIR